MAVREKMNKCFDMLVYFEPPQEEAGKLGFNGICSVIADAEKPGDKTKLEAKLTSGDIRKSARKIIEGGRFAYTELSEKNSRVASECWELDAVFYSEAVLNGIIVGRKPPVDYVSLRNMAERGISFLIPLNQVLDRDGYRRAGALTLLGRTSFLARKAGVNMVLCSGATQPSELRSALDLTYFGLTLGLSIHQSRLAVSKNPASLVAKHSKRNDANTLLSGLKVIDWGCSTPRQPKRVWGWY